MNIPFVDLQAQYQALKKDIDQAIEAVISQTAFIGSKNNPFVKELESNLSEYLGIKHVIGNANGTDAIELVLMALGIGPGDEVIVPAISWFSTSEAVDITGATSVFVDVNAFFNMDTSKIEEKITDRTKAIIPVHLYGQPADLDPILEIGKKHNLTIIEDCAQAIGARYKGKRISTLGHVATYSFYPGKNLGAYGDAGACVTNDDAIAEALRALGNHGQPQKHKHTRVGRNSRLDGLQAAIINTKLPHLDDWNRLRREKAAIYDRLLADIPVEIPKVPDFAEPIYHLYVIRTEKRGELMQFLKENGVSVQIHYPTPLPYLDLYGDRGYSPDDFPVAYKTTQEILSLPLYPEITEEQIEYVVSKIRAFFFG